MNEFSDLIANAVAAKMTPEFIEKEVDTRVEKLITESVSQALGIYSETGKAIKAAVENALRVNDIDLPSYGEVVTKILKAQIEANVAPLVAGRLAADMQELLKLAPETIKLSEIAKDMLERHDGDAYGDVITVICEDAEPDRARWIYLDEDEHFEERDKYKCKIRILLSGDNTISGAYVGEHKYKSEGWIGRSYGLEQSVRAWLACGTKIIPDIDFVCTAVGDY